MQETIRKEEKTRSLELKEGEKITMFAISPFTALTIRTEARFLGLDEKGRIIFRERNKRKDSILYENLEKIIIFRGWDLLIKCDTDIKEGSCVWRGNACFNFLGEKEEVREWIEKKNINKYFEEKGKVLSTDPTTQKESIVFGEIPTNSVVIKRIKEKEERGEQ